MRRVLVAFLVVVGGLAVPALAVVPAQAAEPDTALVGQQTRACNHNADLDIVVVGAERTRAVAGALAPPGTVWVVIVIDVTNVSDRAEALTTRPLQLHDPFGAVFEVQEDPPDPADVAVVYDVFWPCHEFQPGLTERSVLTFLVPEEAGRLTLAGKRDYC